MGTAHAAAHRFRRSLAVVACRGTPPETRAAPPESGRNTSCANDPFGVDELNLNLALADRVREDDAVNVARDIENALLQLTEVKINSTHLLPLNKVLELLGMETQLKEKRIVDLRMQSAAKEEPVAK